MTTARRLNAPDPLVIAMAKTIQADPEDPILMILADRNELKLSDSETVAPPRCWNQDSASTTARSTIRSIRCALRDHAQAGLRAHGLHRARLAREIARRDRARHGRYPRQ